MPVIPGARRRKARVPFGRGKTQTFIAGLRCDRWRLDQTCRLIHAVQPAALIVNHHHHAPCLGEGYQIFARDLR